tara:strand:+ start:12737 stop:14041 length:1305 start_codon:yes stop_codon:yes gene_type:complete
MDTYSVSPSGNFYIHYNLSGPDAPNQSDANDNGIPDYVDEVGIAADYSDSILVDVLGFLPVNHDDNQVYDIYIEDMGQGYYGVNYLDTDILGNHTGSSYIIIDNEYEEGEYYTIGIDGMKTTVVHEYFHAIQRSYRLQFNASTKFLYEMSSTWIEDIVYPNIDDYINDGWTLSFFNNPEQDISDTDGYSIALYAHYLTSVIGNDDDLDNSIIKQIWEQFSIVNNGHSSINTILVNNYSTNFINTWIDFCTRNLYNGYYSDMNNIFYYYSDQINASPIIIDNFYHLNSSININQSLSNESIIIKAFEPSSDFFINIDNLNENIMGNIVSQLQNSANILSIEDLNYSYLEQEIDKIYLFLGSQQESDIDFNLSVYDYSFGDINQNYFINIVDIIYIVNYLFNNIELTNFQFVLADLNIDGIISVLDIVEIVDLIMN